MKKYYLFLSLVALLSFSCEKDDVCPATTQTTPRMVIEFYDIAAPEEIKLVPGLFAIGVDSNGNEVPIHNELVSTRSSIALPLQNNSNQTQFKLYESYDFIDSIVNGNPDTISITYEIETVYLSRACGYINNYSIQTFSIASESDRWMNNSEVLITQVTNENEIHVKVLH
jgi:hypothetical protein|tara:strand:- start:783 stop:1292 length:510 start_codon:yes stop_codon:yes gene_type:complete